MDNTSNSVEQPIQNSDLSLNSNLTKKNKILFIELAVVFFVLILISCIIFMQFQNSAKISQQTKTAVSPTSEALTDDLEVITKDNTKNKNLTDIYLKDKKTKKESFFRTLISTEYALNPEKNLLAFSDYPAIFDEDTRKEYVKKEKKVNLIIYDLKNKTSKVIVTSIMNMFHPQWEDTETLTYTNQGSRISYDILRRGLSYIVIYTDPDVQIKLTDTSGKSVGESFIEGPIGDPTDPSNHGKGIRELDFEKPATGIYLAEFSSTSSAVISYKAEILLYDKDGNDKSVTHSGILRNGKDTIKINFNQLDSNASLIGK